MVTVTVTTAEADPAATGQWSAPFDMGGVAIHATLTRTGDVVFFEYVEGEVGVDRTSRIRVWDPVTGQSRDAGIGYDRDLFCAGHNVLPNGELFASGGHDYASGGKQDGVGVVETDVYDPVTSEWRPTAPMSQARWYPTNVGLGDGTTLIFAGQADGDTWSTNVESYDPATNTMTTLPSSARTTGGNYPRMHLMPNGKVLKTGTAKTSAYFDPETNQWSNLASMQYGTRSKGTSVLLPGLEKVMAIGGQANTGSATATVEILDTSQPQPQWRYTAPMNFPRIHANAVTLPDGQVLVVGGGAAGKYDGPVLAAELYDPVAETWTVMEQQQGGRMYHATTLLLPDGRVLSAGQDSGGYATMGEIFSPPYLFKGPRPTIANAPSSTNYGQSFSFTSPQAADLSKVALIRPGSVTHTVDTDQRYVGLDFTTAGDTVTVTGPANGNVAPPGYYMLFAVDSAGVPSVADFVRVGTGAPPVDSSAPSTPGDVAAVMDGGAVNVTWSASTDNVGVTGYTVRRDGAVVATVPSALTYSDSAVSAGQTYSYTVEALDAAGNVSSASAEAVVTVPSDPPAQGISLRAAETGANTQTATLTVPMPTSVVGDVLLATVDVRGKPTVTAPAGWTLIRTDTAGNAVRKATYWRRATATEPASYTWQFSLAKSAVGSILAYQGVSATEPIQASSGQVHTGSTSITVPSLTTTSPNAVLVGMFGVGGKNATITPPSGMTERSEISTPAGVTTPATGSTADLTLTQPGPTGVLVATSSVSGANVGHLIALNPAGGAPPVDSSAPSTPGDVAAVMDGGAVNVTWSASTDNVGVTGYTVRRDGAVVATVPSALTYSDSAVSAGQTYSYTVEALDAAGNVSSASAEAVVTVPSDPPAQGISLRAAETGANTQTATLTVPMPTSVVGDVLLATVDVRGKPTVTAPAGWTLIRTDTAGNAVRKATYWRRATATEPASYTWQFSLAKSAVGSILAYQGVSATEPIQASSGQVHTGSTSITVPSLTTTSPNAVLVGMFGVGGKNATITPPSGMTERSEISTPAGVTTPATGSTADLTLTQPGPTGVLVATSSVSGANVGHLIALNPASG